MQLSISHHESEINKLKEQIARNNDYKKRSGSTDEGANDLCRNSINEHKWNAAALAALPIPGAAVKEG